MTDKPEEPESEAQGRGCLRALCALIIVLASIVALGITNIKH